MAYYGEYVSGGPVFNDKQTKAMARVATLVTDIGQTWGAGAISTGPLNKAYRSTDPISGLITTVIMVDLTGLKAKGTQATDVIGLDGVANAYIYQNVVANNGIIFKYEISCIKAPTQSHGTITQDIDFAWNSSGTIEYDGAAAATHDTATMVAGETIEELPGVVTAAHYLYLTEGDAAATTGVYASGQFVITLYGYKVR